MFTQVSPSLSTHTAPTNIGAQMNGNNNDHNYPVYAFPDVLRDTILELQRNIQAPIPLVANCVLNAVSLACQRLISVRRLDHLVAPVSLYTFTVADSGERKSAGDDAVLEPIRSYQECQDKDVAEKNSTYLAKILAWNAKQEVLLASIKKAYKAGHTTEDLEKQLAEHGCQKPAKPKKTKLIFDNVSPSELVRSMYDNFGHAALISNEGASILNGKASDDLALLCAMWSGSDIHVDRRNQKSISLRNPRLTIGVMGQFQVVYDCVRRKHNAARNTGLFSRCLMAFPLSTQGTRFIHQSNLSWSSTEKFKRRIEEILEQTETHCRSEGESGLVLQFTPEARARWIQAYNNIEFELTPGGFLFDIRDFGSKAADNMARIAALFHFFSKQEGDISVETVERASEVMKWYTYEFKRLFAAPPPIPQNQADAALLEAWLRSFSHTHKTLAFPKNVALQSGPNPLRNKSRLNAALQVLIWRCVAQLQKQGKTLFIVLNPHYFLGQGGNGQTL